MTRRNLMRKPGSIGAVSAVLTAGEHRPTMKYKRIEPNE